jgi:hypothetical protein
MREQQDEWETLPENLTKFRSIKSQTPHALPGLFFTNVGDFLAVFIKQIVKNHSWDDQGHSF